jgi:hypothetical protein
MKDNLTRSDRPSVWLLGSFGAMVCGLSVLTSSPVIAEELNSSFVVRTEQGETLVCKSPMGSSTGLSFLATSAICERSPDSSSQPLDGATDMLLKLIYLGLPGVVLVGVSLRTLHLHRQLMRQRAFVESLERIWAKPVSYEK